MHGMKNCMSITSIRHTDLDCLLIMKLVLLRVKQNGIQRDRVWWLFLFIELQNKKNGRRNNNERQKQKNSFESDICKMKKKWLDTRYGF